MTRSWEKHGQMMGNAGDPPSSVLLHKELLGITKYHSLAPGFRVGTSSRARVHIVQLSLYWVTGRYAVPRASPKHCAGPSPVQGKSVSHFLLTHSSALPSGLALRSRRELGRTKKE